MENELKKLQINTDNQTARYLVNLLRDFKGCELSTIINVVNSPDKSHELVFLKPAGPEDFTVGETVYRVLDDGAFEESTVKKVWMHFMVVESVQTGKETSCQFRDVFHDNDSPSARTASTERREVWESNAIRSLNQSLNGMHGALNRQAHLVEYSPPDNEGGYMGDAF